jgi:photosystem II stability/assembly factor-like uncharacterized protein
MRFLLITFLFSVNISSIYAQSGWMWLNPRPQGNDLFSIQMINSSTGFAAGAAGTILKTTNGGADWERLITGTHNEVFEIFFINTKTGYASARDRFLKTTDRGKTWIILDTTTYRRNIFFLNENTGFASGNTPAGKLFKTTDGGKSWDGFNMQITQGGIGITDIYFTNEAMGYATGSSRLFRSYNGGVTWDTLSFDTLLGARDIEFINEQTGFVVGTNRTFYKTIDGGESWVTNSFTGQPPMVFYKVNFPSVSTGYILTSTGVQKSTDGGNTWNLFAYLTSEEVRDMSFSDNENGIITGLNGEILKTTNGGLNWNSIDTSIREQYSYLTDIHFFNLNTGFITGGMGSAGILTKTVNSGISWDIREIDSLNVVYNIEFINELTGFICGEGKVIKKTEDGGNSWHTVYTGKTLSRYSSCHFTDGNTGYFAGDGGRHHDGFILKTSDQGKTWITQFPGTANDFKSVYFINPDTGFAGGDGLIAKTTNGGNNWRIDFFGNEFSSIRFINSSTGFAAEGRFIFKTTNAGDNWYIQDSSLSGRTIFFSNENTGYIAGDLNMFKTTDKGESWMEYELGPTHGINAIYFTDSVTGYAAGNNFRILKTTNGGMPIPPLLPQSYHLYQNYPNPFNPQTTIMFNLPEASFVKLKVFDITGREISVIVNDFRTAGAHEITFNGSGLPSGIYFYMLETDNFIESKKMALIK